MNIPLAKAILDTGKKKKTIARLARLEPWELSRVLKGTRHASDKERERLATVLGRSADELFPDAVSA